MWLLNFFNHPPSSLHRADYDYIKFDSVHLMLDDTLDQSFTSPVVETRSGRTQSSQWSSFQRDEALVKADVDDLYREWPSDTLYPKPPISVSKPTNVSVPVARRRGVLPQTQRVMDRVRAKAKAGQGKFPSVSSERQPETPKEAVMTTMEAQENVEAASKSTLSDGKPSPSPVVVGILRRAESLLDQLNKAIPVDSRTLVIPEVNFSENNLPEVILGDQTQAFDKKHPWRPVTHTSEIDLLLQGLSEAYDPEPEVDDLAVKRILSEGGPPPSQITFPRMYESHQRSLRRLTSIRYIHLHLNNVIIYSSNFGIREGVSFVTVKGPKGGLISVANIEKVFLQEKAQVMQQRKPVAHRGKGRIADQFIVGSVSVDRSLSWEVSLSDELVAEWKSDQSAGSLVVELHSAILPPRKGVHTETTCFAKAVIPLYGLLSVESLAASVTCEFHVVRLVHDAVVARMKNLPTGYKVTNADVPRVGSICGRVWLQTHDESFVQKEHLMPNAPALIIPEQSSFSEEKEHPSKLQENNLTSALDYIPSLQQKDRGDPPYWGVYFHAIRLDCEAPIFQRIQIFSGSPIKITLSYKLARKYALLKVLNSLKSLREHVTVESHGVFDGKEIALDFFAIKVMDVSRSKPPTFFECWIEWIHPISSKLQRKLVGVIQIKDFSDGIKNLIIKDFVSDTAIGTGVIRTCRGDNQNDVNKTLESAHNECERTFETTNEDHAPLDTTALEKLQDSIPNTPATEPPESMPVGTANNISEPVGLAFRDSGFSIDSLPEAPPMLSNSITSTDMHMPDKTTGKDVYLNFPSVHMFEIQITNILTQTRMIAPLGALVKYCIETPSLVTDNRSQSLWWDSECKILNGRAQHRLQFESEDDFLVFTQRGLMFEVEISDESKNIDMKFLGSAYIDAALIGAVFQVSMDKRLNLPVMATDGEYVCDLELLLTHFMEPSVIQSTERHARISVDSLDPTKIDIVREDANLDELCIIIESIVNLSFVEDNYVRCECSFPSIKVH